MVIFSEELVWVVMFFALTNEYERVNDRSTDEFAVI